MGSWGTGISSNDTYADISSEFFDLYNDGKKVDEITEIILTNNKDILEISEDVNNLWFAIAKAQWECKQLNPNVFEKVKAIIESDSDLEIWKELGASQSEIKKRQKALTGFLDLLQTERPQSKKRKKKVIRQPLFAAGDCLTFRLANGNFGGAVILAAEFDTGLGMNLVAVTRINQATRPSIADFERAEILIKNWAAWDDREAISWISNYRMHDVAELFEVVCSIKIVGEFLSNEQKYKYSYTSGWRNAVIDCANMQFESEKAKLRPEKKLFIENFSKSSRWKFW